MNADWGSDIDKDLRFEDKSNYIKLKDNHKDL